MIKILFLILLILPIELFAVCSESICQRGDLKITSCINVDKSLLEQKIKDKFLYKNIKITDEIINLYKGVILEGQFENISIIDCESDETKHKTNKKLDQKFFYKGAHCDSFLIGSESSMIKANACCDGDVNAPCLLGFSSYLKEIK